MLRIVMFVVAVVVTIISTIMTRASVEMLPNMLYFTLWLLFWSASLFYSLFYALEEIMNAIAWWVEEVNSFYVDYNHERAVMARRAVLVDPDSIEDFDLEVEDFPFTYWVEEEGEIYLCR